MKKKNLILLSTLFISSFLVGIAIAAIVNTQQRTNKSPFVEISIKTPVHEGRAHLPPVPTVFKKQSAKKKIFNW